MTGFSLTRGQGLLLIALLWLAGIAAVFGLAVTRPDPVVVTHWGSGHVARPTLLPAMAEQFNQAGHKVASGRPITVRFAGYGSQEQADDLVSRLSRGVPLDAKRPDPTVVTPSAGHWLVYANHEAGRAVVDLDQTQSIAIAWTGIVTQREMAECLGWPGKEIGYADILALRADPRGWAAYPCARAEWGQRPLVAYTDPTTSSTGRSVLLTLYAIAAGKPPEQLTVADVNSAAVVDYVKQLQGVVDHYEIGTLPLNTKIYLGPRYGHFFFLPEDNLVGLYQGKESIQIGLETRREPIARSMVMIYPKEGSTAHYYPAGIVQAPWVTPEQIEAAGQWIAFLREDAQQRGFMAEGFRPATGLALADPIGPRFGLDPAKPAVTVNPDRIDPAALAAILRAWDDVKKPGMVTFVVDVSGSMSGDKLAQARDGLIRALDSMAKSNQVGLLTFDDVIRTRIPVAPLAENRFVMATAAREMRAGGNTALYDAIKAGIEMTDIAPGEGNAIRGIVVLTDGLSNSGRTGLRDLIHLMSRHEVPIREFSGRDGVEEGGGRVAKSDIIGSGLALKTRHRIQIFFIGIGKDADMEVGRILAEATGAAFQGATEKDLATVLAEFGKYF